MVAIIKTTNKVNTGVANTYHPATVANVNTSARNGPTSIVSQNNSESTALATITEGDRFGAELATATPTFTGDNNVVLPG